jgi:hypothetical protein
MIDCMFFPCTKDEAVEEMTDTLEKSFNEGGRIRPDYLTKPTIIMCNPNALFYQ